ncbi:MAG: hypothetical protein U1F43_31370 [Myxococcota bacterium]
MGRLTGRNTIVLFIQVRGLALVLEHLFQDVRGDHLRNPRVEVSPSARPGGPPEVLIRIEVELFGRFRQVVASVVPVATVKDGRLTLGMTLGRVDVLSFEGETLGDELVELAVEILAGATYAMAATKTASVALEPLNDVVGRGARAWFAAIEALPAATDPASSSPAIAILLRADEAPAPLGFASPLPDARELALAVDGQFIEAALGHVARDASLPLGLEVERLAFEMDHGTIAVSGLLIRRYGSWRWGATEVAIGGRIGLLFDRARMDATLDTSRLETSLRPGLAWAVGLAAPVLTLIVARMVHSAVRSLVTGGLAAAADRKIDDIEAMLRDRVLPVFSEVAKGLALSLYNAAIVRDELWLEADVAPKA